MAGNKSLKAAVRAKEDEFYTQLTDTIALIVLCILLPPISKILPSSVLLLLSRVTQKHF